MERKEQREQIFLKGNIFVYRVVSFWWAAFQIVVSKHYKSAQRESTHSHQSTVYYTVERNNLTRLMAEIQQPSQRKGANNNKKS